jgi:mannose-6-phosphate isomerase
MVNDMVECPFFKTNFIHLTKDFEQTLSLRDSFTIYMCVEGKASIANENGSATLKKGETALIPACSKDVHIKTTGAKLLEVTI